MDSDAHRNERGESAERGSHKKREREAEVGGKTSARKSSGGIPIHSHKTLTASVWTFEQCLEQANLSIFLKEKNGIPRKTAIRELFKTEMFSDFEEELKKEFNL